MSIAITCPNCQYKITEENIGPQSANAIALHQYFELQRADYVREVEDKLRTELQKSYLTQQEKIERDLKINHLQQVEKERDNFRQQIEQFKEKIGLLDQDKEVLTATRSSDLAKEIAIKSEHFNKLIQQERDLALIEKTALKEEYNKVKQNLQIEVANKDSTIAQKMAEQQLLAQNEINAHKQAIDKKLAEEREIRQRLEEKLTAERELALKRTEAELLKQEKLLADGYQRELAHRNLELAKVTRQLDEKRTLSSGIMGSNLEVEIENFLTRTFMNHTVVKLTKGESRADYLLTLRNEQGQSYGRIVIEVKAGEEYKEEA
ncbi:unnamed protein product [Didymodactylos carnosus]|uniref:DUF2130 domain-containing protein n=1 Tax=Didymodactylos carnosus TaxID=1234261 RepID=A0A8S2GDY2_9BILA|nr:unnamed protein product [Didymodactylos carnosus]CAF3491864.1 unnamed protein product [Didymodactylos carnosus]